MIPKSLVALAFAMVAVAQFQVDYTPGNLATVVMNQMDNFWQDYVAGTNAIANIAAFPDTQTANLVMNPYPCNLAGCPSATCTCDPQSTAYSILPYAQVFFNSSTSKLTNMAAQSVTSKEAQWGSTTGFSTWFGGYFSGTGNRNSSGAVIAAPGAPQYTVGNTYPYAAVIPPSTQPASIYSCPSRQAYFYVNTATAEPTSQVPFYQGNYNICNRPWFWPTINTNLMTYTLYYSSASGCFKYSVGRQYSVSASVINSASTFLWMENITTMFTKAAASLGNNQVGYLMTTSNPVGLLLATNVPNLYMNQTQYAANAENAFVSQTARYLKTNPLSSGAQVYMEELGCLMTVQYWTWGTGPTTATTVMYPSAAQQSAWSTAVNYKGVSTPYTWNSPANIAWSGTGVALTFVSCETMPNPTAEGSSTTTTSDSAVFDSTTAKAIGSLALITFILVLLMSLCMLYNMASGGRGATPMGAKGQDNL